MTATIASPELLDFINWTALPQLGQYPHGAITGRGEILVPPTEPGDKPIILRPDDRPKKQSTRMLKAECPECGYTIRLTKKWADVGLPRCPTRWRLPDARRWTGGRWRGRPSRLSASCDANLSRRPMWRVA
jgi:hypothetical protein